ncbi:MAG: hypothetical protein EPO11_09775, partial [Gammaproteobacteria bacterium]
MSTTRINSAIGKRKREQNCHPNAMKRFTGGSQRAPELSPAFIKACEELAACSDQDKLQITWDTHSATLEAYFQPMVIFKEVLVDRRPSIQVKENVLLQQFFIRLGIKQLECKLTEPAELLKELKGCLLYFLGKKKHKTAILLLNESQLLGEIFIGKNVSRDTIKEVMKNLERTVSSQCVELIYA